MEPAVSGICATPLKILHVLTALRRDSVDEDGAHRYLFDNACMTPLGLSRTGAVTTVLQGAWQKGNKLRLVRSLDFRGWVLV
ncbi:MAG TPA: hypothetical protein VII41_00345, partial [Steroidobacteraceae bacterium]